jgi:hypothetical protein
MAQHTNDRSSQTRSALFDPPEQAQESSARTQFKRSLSGMDYAQQVEAVRPPAVVDTLQTLQESPVQHEGGGDTDSLRQVAAQGLQGSASSLPYLGTLQSAFGNHDVSGVKAYSGGSAQQANAAMGSVAYATGNAVAFKGTPDLHTVAHEAAHVVQQRAGVSLPGGVGRVGDAYEQHADAVAERVVSGQSAAPLLDAVTRGDSPATAVQMKHGDLDTAVDPNLVGGQTMTIREAVAANFGEVAREKETFNNKAKVQFETELALALTSDPSFYEGVVHGVSKNIMEYIRIKVGEEDATVSTAIRAELQKLEGMYGHMNGKPDPNLLFGRIKDASDQAGINEVLDALIGVLDRGEGTISNHMYAHHQFMDHIYGKDYYAGREGKGAKNSVAARILAQIDSSFQAVEPKYLRAVAEGNPFGLQVDSEGHVTHVEVKTGKGKGTEVTTPGYGKYNELSDSGKEGRHARGRKFDLETAKSHGRTTRTGIATEDESGATLNGSSPVPEELDTGQTHGRGVDIYVMDEAQTFVQEARVLYDMPLAAGVSGTTTDLLECAMTFGVTSADDKFKYVLGVLDQLMNAGAHSFHEIMSAASFAGVQYEPGNYRSLLQHPAIVTQLGSLFLKPEYQGIYGIDPNIASPGDQPVTVPATPGGT